VIEKKQARGFVWVQLPEEEVQNSPNQSPEPTNCCGISRDGIHAG
jgi:hypothetical protein